MINLAENLKCFHLPSAPGIEIISGHRINNSLRRHQHRTFIIGQMIKGSRSIAVDNRNVRIDQGDVFVINPGQVHACTCDRQQGHSYLVLSIDTQAMEKFVAGITGHALKRPWFTKIRYCDQKISSQLIGLFDQFNDQNLDLVRENVNNLLKDMLSGCSVQTFETDLNLTEKTAIQRVIDYIAQNTAWTPSLERLADIACLSPFHFQREFKKNIGLTPHEYLHGVKIRNARNMLMKSESIADVAVALGYVDQSHFSRVFKSLMGISPGKYIKANKSMKYWYRPDSCPGT